MELKDTVDLMTSDDYKDRFRAEYYQLKIRTERLRDMVTKYSLDELDFEPNTPLEVLDDQLNAMEDYLETLEDRANLEDILLTY